MPSTSNQFEIAYQLLNTQQKLAVDTLEGPVMVIAGPGTGKTQVLTTRIANLLTKTDTTPDAILALTFTDSGAKAMRQRLLQLIGPVAYRLHIATFHGFCHELITTYPDYFIIGNNPSPLTDLDRLQLIKTILDSQRFDHLRPLNAPDLYLSALISSIQTLKRENVSPDQLQQLLKSQLEELELSKDDLTANQFLTQEKALLKNLELVTVYRHYQQQITKSGRYDFEDMINLCIDKFQQDPIFLSAIQEKYHYFLVDEYQDTNNSQNQLLRLLCSFFADNPNLFVVLDDEQSIFRFQGASLENPLDFLDRYPTAQVITLTDNYRSQQHILDASRNLIENNLHNLQHRLPHLTRQLVSQTDHKLKKITIVTTPHSTTENLYIVNRIQELVTSGVEPSQVAIIVRNNADLKPLSMLLAQNMLPFTSSSPGELLDSLPVKYLIRLFQAVEHSRLSIDDLDLFTILNFPFLGFDPLEVLKVSRAAATSRSPLFDTLTTSEIFQPFIKQLVAWNSLSVQLTFVDFTQKLIAQSGLLDWVIAHPQVGQFLPDINAFFSFIKNQNQSKPNLTLSDFLHQLDLMIQNRLPLSSVNYQLPTNSITLTTAHKAKGLEWEYVFVTGCVDGHWGNQTSRQLIKLPPSILSLDTHEHPLEDERRLFYVACTRAKKELFLTYAEAQASSSKSKPSLPSQFLSELPSSLVSHLDPQFTPEQLASASRQQLSPPELTDSESDLLISILTDFKLSVTALNTYLTCPYKFKLNDLFKAPQAKEPYLAFGTAIHTALQKFHQQLATVSHPSKVHLLQQFKLALQNETLTKADFQERLLHGNKVLTSYYDFFASQFTPPLFNEKKFGTTNNPILLGDIPLTGKIDRIDLVQLPRGDRMGSPGVMNQLVCVVDYKTGSRKTRGEIEGTTQSSNGDLKRQLVFYKLLTELDTSFPYTMVEAQLDFIETPHKDHKSGREAFQVTPQEVEQLKELIRQSMQKIRQLEFPRTTDYSNCQRCQFLQHCWPAGLPTGSVPEGG